MDESVVAVTIAELDQVRPGSEVTFGSEQSSENENDCDIKHPSRSQRRRKRQRVLRQKKLEEKGEKAEGGEGRTLHVLRTAQP